MARSLKRLFEFQDTLAADERAVKVSAKPST
jgi:hypothetical protein